MSTPTEAHQELLREIRSELAHGAGPKALQLLSDSEARAVEAARTMLLDAWREETTEIQHVLNDAEISDFPLTKGVQRLGAALTAERERVRVLEEGLGRIEDAADKHSFGGDMLAWAGDVATAALALTTPERKEGSG